MQYVPLFVTVEATCHSNHRSPQGIYQIDVVQEKTALHNACAAVQIAKDSVPFLDENPTSVVRVFTQKGHEVVIPKFIETTQDHLGRFKGRSKNYPAIINDILQ